MEKKKKADQNLKKQADEVKKLKKHYKDIKDHPAFLDILKQCEDGIDAALKQAMNLLGESEKKATFTDRAKGLCILQEYIKRMVD